MNSRHQNQMNQPLITSALCLNRYLLDKSAQARKLVQWCYIDPILREARMLFVNATDLLDGLDTKNKALRNVYNIQKQTVLVCFLEQDNRKKKEESTKRKKHYGFDSYACAYIDEMCDDIISQVSAYGQSHQPYNRG